MESFLKTFYDGLQVANESVGVALSTDALYGSSHLFSVGDGRFALMTEDTKFHSLMPDAAPTTTHPPRCWT